MAQAVNCVECARGVSYETGFAISGTLAPGGDRIYCPDCNPDKGRGYTLSDLNEWREQNQAERARHEVAMMDLVGPDVYFAVKGQGGKPSPMKRLLDLNQRMYDKLREIGVRGDL